MRKNYAWLALLLVTMAVVLRVAQPALPKPVVKATPWMDWGASFPMLDPLKAEKERRLLVGLDVSGVRLGMSQSDVRQVLGAPNQDSSVDNPGYPPTWWYWSGPTVDFDKGRVHSVEGPTLRFEGHPVATAGPNGDTIQEALVSVLGDGRVTGREVYWTRGTLRVAVSGLQGDPTSLKIRLNQL